MNKLYQDKEWLYQKYIVKKLSMQKIAILCKVSYMPIHYWLKKLHITIRSISETNLGRHHSEETKRRISEANKGKRTGDKSYNWKGGVTSINDRNRNRIRRTKEYKDWANSVYKRDKHICQMCGLKCGAKNIIAHHIKNFLDYPELRFDINNGITLCRSCHKKIHKEIGMNTRFKNAKLSKPLQPALAI